MTQLGIYVATNIGNDQNAGIGRTITGNNWRVQSWEYSRMIPRIGSLGFVLQLAAAFVVKSSRVPRFHHDPGNEIGFPRFPFFRKVRYAPWRIPRRR